MPISRRRRIGKRRKKKKMYCICQLDLVNTDMIACSNKSCEIVWYHFQCIGVSDAPDNEWFCPDCVEILSLSDPSITTSDVSLPDKDSNPELHLTADMNKILVANAVPIQDQKLEMTEPQILHNHDSEKFLTTTFMHQMAKL